MKKKNFQEDRIAQLSIWIRELISLAMIYSKQYKSIVFILIMSSIMMACKNDGTDKSQTSSNIVSLNRTSGQSLWEHAPFPIGGAISINKVLADEKLEDITTQNFNSITATNDMKMYSIYKTDEYNFKKVDQLLAYCEQHDKRLFGHALLWHHAFPEWIENKLQNEDSEASDQFIKEYITKVVSRYKGKVAAWDVVNEAFENNGGTYRKTFWYNQLGKEYIEKAFTYAHAADPDAVLFYNDFNIDRDTVKLNAVLEMIDEFKSRGVPIHGLGFQWHLRMDIPNETIAYTLEKAAATGLQIHISELDITFNKHNDHPGGAAKPEYPELTEEMKIAQARKYKDLVLMYGNIVPKEQQFGITFWDFNDRDTWIRPFFKMLDWPTLFDDNLDPKPAYFSFAEALKELSDKSNP